jgi:hypothetical protein
MKTYLNPKADFPFTKEDFIQEFSVYQDRFEVFWFDDVSSLVNHHFFKIDAFIDDIDVIGFNIPEKEFFLGTYEHEWCIFSCRKKKYYEFKYLQTNNGSELHNLLRQELEIPNEIIYSVIRILSKY